MRGQGVDGRKSQGGGEVALERERAQRLPGSSIVDLTERSDRGGHDAIFSQLPIEKRHEGVDRPLVAIPQPTEPLSCERDPDASLHPGQRDQTGSRCARQDPGQPIH